MKKFWVSFLSVLVLFGGVILASCGKKNVSIELSASYVEVCVNDDALNSATISAEVLGLKDKSVTVSSSNKSVAIAENSFSRGKNIITITGLAEGETDIIVTSNQNSNYSSKISVLVYSKVESLTPNSVDGAKDFYAIRNDVTLNSETESLEKVDLNKKLKALLKIEPENARADIHWSLADGFSGDVRLENDILTIGKDFNQDTINLFATDSNTGKSTEVLLTVIDKLSASSTMTYQFKNGGVQTLQENGEITLVSGNDEESNSMAILTLKLDARSLQKVTPQAKILAGGEPSSLLYVTPISSENGEYKFEIRPASPFVNQTFDVCFTLGYPQFNYYVDTFHFVVKSYEQIRRMEILNSAGVDATFDPSILDQSQRNPQSIYTNYAGSSAGAMYKVNIMPEEVLGATYAYNVTLDFSKATVSNQGGLNPDGSMDYGDVISKETLLFYYRKADGNLDRLYFDEVSDSKNIFTSRNSISAKEIYIKGNESLIQNYILGAVMVLASEDNRAVNAYSLLNLYKSAGVLTFEEGDKTVNLSTDVRSEKTITFTLKGQVSLEGLYVEKSGEGFSVSDITLVQDDSYAAVNDSVTFSLTFSATNVGYTGKGAYQIKHRNGNSSKVFDVNLYFPLTDARLSYDASGSSVMNSTSSTDLYLLTGESLTKVVGATASTDSLLVRNGTNTRLVPKTNESRNGQSAEAKLSYYYYDYETFVGEGQPSEDLLRAFLNLDVNTIFANKRAESNKFKVTDDIINAFNVGHSYLVVMFTGLDGRGEQVNFVRVIAMESYVLPTNMAISPRGVEVYSRESGAEDNEITKFVRIDLGSSQVTYNDYSNYTFTSGVFGKPSETSSTLTSKVWDNGYYEITDFDIQKSFVSFNITGITTRGVASANDILTITYQSGKDKREIPVVLDIRVKNAQRVENLTLENYDKDENGEYNLYFDIRDEVPSTLIFSSTPQTAKNSTLAYYQTDKDGGRSEFVEIKDDYNGAQVSLKFRSGMVGYIYALPADAVSGGNIYYYYKNGQNPDGSDKYEFSSLPIGQIGQANGYEYLIDHAYFFNNKQEAISFRNILVKIKVTVADGSTEELAYHIYDESGFKNNFDPTNWYRVMNNITLTSWQSIGVFAGGIVGNSSEVTLTLLPEKNENGRVIRSAGSFVNVNNGTIKKLTFAGQVTGEGFVTNSNNGTIDGVTIDVLYFEDKWQPSTISGMEQVGAIAGINTGIIKNVRVQGTSVWASGYAGGIVGKMTANASIENARFEIYTFVDGVHNVVSGTFAGGVIGWYEGGTIDKVYAYDYSLSAPISETNKCNIQGSTKSGALIGYLAESVTITKAFSVTGLKEDSLVGESAEGKKLNLTDSYVGYYINESEKTKYHVHFFTDTDTSAGIYNANWAKPGNIGYLAYVNKGEAHLKDFYQDEPVENVGSYEITTSKTRGLYRSLKVDNAKVILFKVEVSPFDLQNMQNSDHSALRDLTSLNTIQLSDIVVYNEEKLSQNVAHNLVISSSDNNIIDIEGSNLIIKNTGRVTLTLSSKQDFNLSKPFEIRVVNSISDIRASRTFLGGSTEIPSESIVNLQKGKNLTVNYSFMTPSLYLGTQGKSYELIYNSHSFVSQMEGKYENIEQAGSTFTYVPNDLSETYSISTTVKLNDILLDEIKDKVFSEKLQEAVQKNFTLKVFEGALALSLSGEQVSITPSSMGVVEVTLVTGDKDDYILPSVQLKSGNLTFALDVAPEAQTTREQESAQNDPANVNAWIASYNGEQRLRITREVWSTKDEAGIYTKTTTFYFSVVEEYRGEISEEQRYEIGLQSMAGVEGLEKKTFDLVISRQDFTNIDVANYQVYATYYEKITGTEQYAYMYYVRENIPTSVITKSSPSIFTVNINPEYAYYNSMSVEYSGGTTLNPLRITYMQKDSAGKFYENFDGSQVSAIANGIQVTPKEKNTNYLYFKLWASSEIAQDENFAIIVKFYDEKGELIGKAINYFLTVSVLDAPRIYVNGQTTAVVAKGQTAKVEIVVNYDQEVDINSFDVDNVISGVTVYSSKESWVISEDKEAGTRTYSTTMSVSIRAKLEQNSNVNNQITLSVSVRRTMNGSEETSSATAFVHVVEFGVDMENVTLKNHEDDNFIAYLGVAQPLEFNYPLLPEEYQHDQSNQDNIDAMKEINEARDNFLGNGYYINEQSRYFINYDRKTNSPILINQRLAYRSESGNYVDIYDNNNGFNTIGNRLSWAFDRDKNTITVEGTSLSSDIIPMRLRTTMSVGDRNYESEYYFNILIKAYSDEDVPLLVTSEEEFLNMAEGDEQNYILMNDITLRNYSPISTNSIASFDGNGFTITIENFDLSPTGGLNLALFNNVTENTTLKNVRVNVYSGGQITVDVSKYTSSNIAGFVISNEGVITNCEVVTYSGGRDDYSESGLVVTYVNGFGTAPIYLTGSNVTSNVAGFVVNNSGSITNSRVGGEDIYLLRDAYFNAAGKQIGYYRQQVSLDKFTIVAQGNVAGFVNTNSGAIASSFVKRVGINNPSNSSSFFTAGFVGVNTGRILTSYVEGVRNQNAGDMNSITGSSIASRQGIIAGFIYQNSDSGIVRDAYSNILIANQSSEADGGVYLASGFVYINMGTLENCYSASQIANLRYSQMNFSGVDNKGDLQTSDGKYINSYYYTTRTATDPTETSYQTGATKLSEISDEKYFYGFSFTSEGKTEGVWRLTQYGPKLVEADNLALSNRYRAGDPNHPEDNERYTLPYSTVYEEKGGVTSSLTLYYGSKYNPIIIRSAQEFANVTGNSSSSYISKYFTDTSVIGNYRLVRDIDFSDLFTQDKTVNLPSTHKAFTGVFHGNGFTMSNLSISGETEGDSARQGLAYGLFATIENGIVINVNISVTNQVNNTVASFVGALAGYVKNSNIVNVTIEFNEGAYIQGLNFVGGAIGMVFGDSKIKSVTAQNPTVIATTYLGKKGTEGTEGSDATSVGLKQVATLTGKGMSSLRNMINSNAGGINLTNLSKATEDVIKTRIANYSYAGGLFGLVDAFAMVDSSATGYSYVEEKDLTNSMYHIVKTRAIGIINVRGQVAGGLAGFTGYNTYVKDAGVELDDSQTESASHILATGFYAGGLVGQAYGAFAQSYTRYSSDIQDNIENSVAAFYSATGESEHGSTSIFTLVDDGKETYYQKYVGGLIGYVGSGSLLVSLSKLNVVSNTAEFVGGLVGVINTGNASSYLIKENNEEFYSNFFIHEAYTTGDVRGVYSAGGVIGQIKLNSNISLFAVNSANFLSSAKYDGTDNKYSSSDLNISTDTNRPNYTLSRINVYSIIGDVEIRGTGSDSNKVYSFMRDKASHKRNEQAAAEAIQSMIEFRQAKLIKDDSEGDDGQYYSRESVGSFDKITMGGIGLVNVESFPGMTTMVDNSTGEFRDTRLKTFAMADPSTFATAAIGNRSTYGSFLGTNFWSSYNWYHNNVTLYPEIRFSVAQEQIIYLDQFNKEEVLSAMRENNVHVIVRGQVAPNILQYQDVDLRRELKSRWGSYADSNALITNFRGQISTESTEITGKKINVILNTPWIESVAEGFSVNGLSLIYSNNRCNADGTLGNGMYDSDLLRDSLFDQNKTKKFKGAFVNDTITNASVMDLSMSFNCNAGPIRLNGENSNAGLVAGKISNTNLSTIKITFTSRNESAVSVTNVNNFGLIAGALEQGSSTSEMKVSDLSIEDKGAISNFINVIPNGDLNAGVYFGVVQKVGGGSEALNIDKLKPIITESNDARNINVSGGQTVNVGGFVGRIGKDIEIGFNLDNVNMSISNSGTISSLNAGLIVGSSEQALNFNYDQVKQLNGKIYGTSTNSKVNTNANLGGLVGQTSANLKVENVNVNFEVAGNSNGAFINDKSAYADGLDPRRYSFNSFKVEETANIGGYVGYASSGLKVTGSAIINSDQKAISVSANSANIGSVAGLVEKQVSQENTEVLIINGNIQSQAILHSETTGTAAAEQPNNSETGASWVGGLIGRIDAQKSTTAEATASYIVSIRSSEKSGFIGQMFINAKNAYLGGIIGKVDSSSTNQFDVGKQTFTLRDAVFGGAMKIYGSNSEQGSFQVGGLVGEFKTQDRGSSTDNFTIENNYTFGDFFALYDDYFTATNQVHYGGLIGNANNNMSANAVRGNYVLNTYNNTRPNVNDLNGTNALFGTGNFGTSGNFSIGTSNYYNHAVCLLTDDWGRDAGYMTNYKESESTTGGGYKANEGLGLNFDKGEIKIENISTGLAQKIKREVSSVYNDETSGSKLNPIKLNPEGNSFDTIDSSSTKAVFNGMRYYYLAGDLEIGASKKIMSGDVLNVAIIGDGYTIDARKIKTTDPFISMSGQSFMSGFNINVNSAYDMLSQKNEQNEDIVQQAGGLMTRMNGGTIYAVGVLGTLSIGGPAVVRMGGIAGEISGGYISNSYTDIKLIYRARGSNIADGNGVTNAVTGAQSASIGVSVALASEKVIIDRTYAVGEIYTYSGSTMDAFVAGSNADVRNCYTATYCDYKNYTNGNTARTTASCINAFSGATGNLSDSYYDSDAINAVVKKTGKDENKNPKDSNFLNSVKGIAKTTEGLFPSEASTAEPLLDSSWVQDFNFNYAYPTRSIGYLKQSSFAKAEELGTSEAGSWDLYGNGETSIENSATEISLGTQTNKYTRLTRKETPSFDKYYYIVPNRGILAKIISYISISTNNKLNILLKNDIDMDTTSNKGSLTFRNLKDGFTLDGNGHRIYHLNKPLFGQIGTSSSQDSNTRVTKQITTINNIRNIDFMITRTNAVVAEAVFNTTLENISVSGDGAVIVSSAISDGGIGSLANYVGNSNLINVMNNLMIIDKQAERYFLGGIVGWADSCYISSCVNNGPINSRCSDHNQSTVVGGIVGGLAMSTIENSYNTAYLTANYEYSVNSESYVGGICGFATGSGFDNCYNSGMVKSGDKYCTGKDTFMQMEYLNYAGGIVAYAGEKYFIGLSSGKVIKSRIIFSFTSEDSEEMRDKAIASDNECRPVGIYRENGKEIRVTCVLTPHYWLYTETEYPLNQLGNSSGVNSEVTNCFNDGNVEALAQNANFNFQTTKVADKKYRVSIIQSSKRNVYACSIGFVNGETINSHNFGTVINNGAALQEMEAVYENINMELQSLEFKQALSERFVDSEYYSHGNYETSSYDAATPYLIKEIPEVPYLQEGKEYDVRCIPRSFDEFGCPTSFYLKYPVLYKYTNEGYHSHSSNAGGNVNENYSLDKIVKTFVTYDYESWTSFSQEDNPSEKLGPNAYKYAGTAQKENERDEESINHILRPSDSNQKETFVNISGDKYYLTNENSDSVYTNLNAETEFTVKIRVQKSDDFNLYGMSVSNRNFKVNVTKNGIKEDDVEAYVSSCIRNERDGYYDFTIAVSSSKKLEELKDLEYNISYQMINTQIVSFSSLNYAYFGNGVYGIVLENELIRKLIGISTDENVIGVGEIRNDEFTYKVFKASCAGISNPLYLAIDEQKKMAMYYPNITLFDGTKVNTTQFVLNDILSKEITLEYFETTEQEISSTYKATWSEGYSGIVEAAKTNVVDGVGQTVIVGDTNKQNVILGNLTDNTYLTSTYTQETLLVGVVDDDNMKYSMSISAMGESGTLRYGETDIARVENGGFNVLQNAISVNGTDISISIEDNSLVFDYSGLTDSSLKQDTISQLQAISFVYDKLEYSLTISKEGAGLTLTQDLGSYNGTWTTGTREGYTITSNGKTITISANTLDDYATFKTFVDSIEWMYTDVTVTTENISLSPEHADKNILKAFVYYGNEVIAYYENGQYTKLSNTINVNENNFNFDISNEGKIKLELTREMTKTEAEAILASAKESFSLTSLSQYEIVTLGKVILPDEAKAEDEINPNYTAKYEGAKSFTKVLSGSAESQYFGINADGTLSLNYSTLQSEEAEGKKLYFGSYSFDKVEVSFALSKLTLNKKNYDIDINAYYRVVSGTETNIIVTPEVIPQQDVLKELTNFGKFVKEGDNYKFSVQYYSEELSIDPSKLSEIQKNGYFIYHVNKGSSIVEINIDTKKEIGTEGLYSYYKLSDSNMEPLAYSYEPKVGEGASEGDLYYLWTYGTNKYIVAEKVISDENNNEISSEFHRVNILENNTIEIGEILDAGFAISIQENGYNYSFTRDDFLIRKYKATFAKKDGKYYVKTNGLSIGCDINTEKIEKIVYDEDNKQNKIIIDYSPKYYDYITEQKTEGFITPLRSSGYFTFNFAGKGITLYTDPSYSEELKMDEDIMENPNVVKLYENIYGEAYEKLYGYFYCKINNMKKMYMRQEYIGAADKDHGLSIIEEINENASSTKYADYVGIVVSRNISFGIKRSIVFEDKLNGNDYNIIYSGDSFSTSFIKKITEDRNSFIRDLNVITQIMPYDFYESMSLRIGYEGPYIAGLSISMGYKSKISNVNLFGNIRDVPSSSGNAYIGRQYARGELLYGLRVAGGIGYCTGQVENFNVYVSINGEDAKTLQGENQYHTVEITRMWRKNKQDQERRDRPGGSYLTWYGTPRALDVNTCIAGIFYDTHSRTDTINYYGLLVAGNGGNGRSGANGTVSTESNRYTRSAKTGEDGGFGGDVCIIRNYRVYDEKNEVRNYEVNNYGFVIVGKSGSAGAGGQGARNIMPKAKGLRSCYGQAGTEKLGGGQGALAGSSTFLKTGLRDSEFIDPMLRDYTLEYEEGASKYKASSTEEYLLSAEILDLKKITNKIGKGVTKGHRYGFGASNGNGGAGAFVYPEIYEQYVHTHDVWFFGWHETFGWRYVGYTFDPRLYYHNDESEYYNGTLTGISGDVNGSNGEEVNGTLVADPERDHYLNGGLKYHLAYPSPDFEDMMPFWKATFEDAMDKMKTYYDFELMFADEKIINKNNF